MTRGWLAALLLAGATPALAQQNAKDTTKNAAKDLDDTANHAVSKGKDALGTDSGAEKEKRQAEDKAREAQKKACQEQHNAEYDAQKAKDAEQKK
jgi:hypothetical protein